MNRPHGRLDFVGIAVVGIAAVGTAACTRVALLRSVVLMLRVSINIVGSLDITLTTLCDVFLLGLNAPNF